jgi:hypothetical protein
LNESQLRGINTMTVTSFRLHLLLAAFGLLIGACPLCASTLPVPPGLNPGDHYYLLFFTRQTDAVSPDISTYNTIANADADALGWGAANGVTWHAFVSTTTESVTANVPTAPYPVYNISYGLPADRIASDPRSLLTDGPLIPIGPSGGGTIEFPGNPIVWTGFNPSDLTDLSGGLGAPFVTEGDGMYTGIYAFYGAGSIPDQSLPFYAISDLLTVPVPEPSTGAVLIAAAVFAALVGLESEHQHQVVLDGENGGRASAP